MFLTRKQNQHLYFDSNASSPVPVTKSPVEPVEPAELPRISSSLEKYGWFEEIDPSTSQRNRNYSSPNDDEGQFVPIEEDEYISRNGSHDNTQDEDFDPNLELPLPLTEPPSYILEAPLTSQHLWYTTAGTRPRQPPEERRRLEQIWTENFVSSSIQYPESVLVPNKGNTDKTENIQSLRVEYNEEVKGRGKGPFSNAVSKSFMNHCISCMTIQVPRYKVVRPLSGENDSHSSTFHAEFLVVISLGSVPHGVWRRHSEFKNLFRKVNSLNNTCGPYHDLFKNTIASWQCIVNRQRWFRCLEKNYLSLKCFLIERFMQDLLFESPTPDLINEFLGFNPH